MCGIFGIHCSEPQELSLTALQSAAARLRHRGPDDEGYLLAGTKTGRLQLCSGRDTVTELNQPSIESCTDQSFDLALGFRRLSILDLSPAGHQPMTSPDGKCWIVFNGEIYNYVELKAELHGYGYRFRTGTDTEVILAAYQHWGVGCLSHFIGMWAFALVDFQKNCLLLARDPFGIKPLYYAQDAQRLAFASEIKVLLESFEVGRNINADRLYDYLRFGISDYGAETIFAEVKQLPAAHYLLMSLDDPTSIELRRYWKIDFNIKNDISFETAAARLRELFLQSIKIHLRSDVPVGTALSGGIDSSAIVMAMRHLDPDLEIHTFSYIADDPVVSEERWVDLVNAAARAVSHKVQPTPAELAEDLNSLIGVQDEPFGSTSIYAGYRVFNLAHESGIKVMLDGQGGDELLAGYPFYLVARAASLLRSGKLIEARRLIGHVSNLPQFKGMNLLASAGAAMLPANIRRLVRRASENGTVPSWLNDGWFRRRGVESRQPFKGQHPHLLQAQLYDSVVETSLPMLLRYEDRNSMAQSIESRVPFLTTELAEFILSLPDEYLIGPDGTSKRVFRQAMRGIVPDEILNRRDKIGFATPERSWLRTLRPWVEGVLGNGATDIPVLNLVEINQEWKAIVAGDRFFDFRVWRWLNVIRWSQEFEVSFG